MAAVMYFLTRKAFTQMLSDPEFQSASRHRKASQGIARQRLQTIRCCI